MIVKKVNFYKIYTMTLKDAYLVIFQISNKLKINNNFIRKQ